ncbi:hypothetical protein NIVACYA_01375 [Planktothrix agardhii]|nr:hypothetical protein NO108_00370 [Planktothrix rubescens]CAD5925374.1 hypothetical protein NIVACYA_01375 [Planktothrix agardhii]
MDVFYKIDRVIKVYSLEANQRTFIIILEDFGASSLTQFIGKFRLYLPSLLLVYKRIIP